MSTDRTATSRALDQELEARGTETSEQAGVCSMDLWDGVGFSACGQPAAVEVQAACVHEHLRTRELCQTCDATTPGEQTWCGRCFEAGVRVPVVVLNRREAAPAAPFEKAGGDRG